MELKDSKQNTFISLPLVTGSGNYDVTFDYLNSLREASKYGELCARIQKQIDETRMRISSVKMQLHIADHALDQALLQWKYEYLMKQEQWLVELMCGKIEEEKQEEKQ